MFFKKIMFKQTVEYLYFVLTLSNKQEQSIQSTRHAMTWKYLQRNMLNEKKASPQRLHIVWLCLCKILETTQL